MGKTFEVNNFCGTSDAFFSLGVGTSYLEEIWENFTGEFLDDDYFEDVAERMLLTYEMFHRPKGLYYSYRIGHS